MKLLTRENQKIRYTSSDLFILAISFAFTGLIAFGSNKFLPFSNNHLIYSIALVVLFYLFRREKLKLPLSGKLRKQHKNLIIIGNGKLGMEIASNINQQNDTELSLICVLSKENNIEGEIKQSLAKGNIDEILISIDGQDYNEIFDVIDICQKFEVPVKLCSELLSIIPQKIRTEYYFGTPVIDVTKPKRVKYYDKLKRVVDIVIALSALIILSPLILTLATIIKLTSKGPIIYSQKRVGINGRLFDFYKFRSMYKNEGEDEKRKAMMLDFMSNNNACKIIDEKRVTPIGRVIRKTSLDELPQLYNVILGDMSIVGPRPCLKYEFEQYAEWQKRRIIGLPGCTGIWQVSGRSNVSFNDSIVLDLYYLMKMSPLYDIKLTFKTIPVMLFSRGGK